ncbi:MAG: YgeY family selenium metabolism-linked hydrolase [Anaerolineae bacterium]|nr:YgeY family selenium metabolism-linked hydrolase [Anaerolineae bacterium]
MNLWQRIRDRSRELGMSTAENLSAIVQIPSLSGEEGPVIACLAELCERAGFDHVRIDGLGNLIARVGSGPRILAIDAHIDTVDTGDRGQWRLDPFSGHVADGLVHGRGSVDQKGGAACMITAGQILKELGYDGAYSVYCTFTVMEEDCDGLCWNYLIEREGLVPEFAVITEPTNLGLYRGQRGRAEFELAFGGLSAHGSAPERGDNAIYRASETALRVRELHDRLPTDEFLGPGSVAVTLIRSESPSLCAIPDQCMIHLDRRLTWGETKGSATAELEAICGDKTVLSIPTYSRQSYRGTVHEQEKYFPTWKTPADHPLVAAGARTYALLFGEEPRVDKWTFSTNGVAISGKHGIPCIGFGPGNEVYAHAPNEAIPIEHLERAPAFYALLPYILGGESG